MTAIYLLRNLEAMRKLLPDEPLMIVYDYILMSDMLCLGEPYWSIYKWIQPWHDHCMMYASSRDLLTIVRHMVTRGAHFRIVNMVLAYMNGRPRTAEALLLSRLFMWQKEPFWDDIVTALLKSQDAKRNIKSLLNTSWHAHHVITRGKCESFRVAIEMIAH